MEDRVVSLSFSVWSQPREITKEINKAVSSSCGTEHQSLQITEPIHKDQEKKSHVAYVRFQIMIAHLIHVLGNTSKNIKSVSFSTIHIVSVKSVTYFLLESQTIQGKHRFHTLKTIGCYSTEVDFLL